jgi:hypothetical protein
MITGSSSDDIIAYSYDAHTWTVAGTFPSSDARSAFIHTDGVFLVMDSYAENIWTSTDGLSWASNAMPTGYYWWGVVSNGSGRLVAVSDETAVCISDDYGATWTNTQLLRPIDIDLNPTSYSYQLTWHDGLFIVVCGYDYTEYFVSPDGITWEARDFGDHDSWFDTIAFNSSGRALILPNNGATPTTIARWSDDLFTWTEVETPEAHDYAVAEGSPRGFLRYEGNGFIYTSKTGTSWTQVDAMTGSEVYWNGSGIWFKSMLLLPQATSYWPNTLTILSAFPVDFWTGELSCEET